jgi:hypothetical protein
MNTIKRIEAVSALRIVSKQSVIRAAMDKCLKAFSDVCDKAKAKTQSKRLTTEEQLHNLVHKKSGGEDKSKAETIARASIMYRLAMPPLDSYAEIHAYIACVAQGVALGIFSGRDGSQLLYAAQVALSVVQVQAKGKEECQPKQIRRSA